MEFTFKVVIRINMESNIEYIYRNKHIYKYRTINRD